MPDIYQHEKRPEEPANRVRPGADVWSISHRRRRLQNFLSVVFILCIIGLVLFISLQQYQVSRLEAMVEEERGRAPDALFAHTPLEPASLRPMEEYLLDALEGRPDYEPMGEQTPFHREWIKQSAYHIVRAEEARRGENHQRALAEYEAALAIFPDMIGLHETIGLIHIDQRDYEEAAAAFERALAHGASAHGAANNLGIALLQLDRIEEAEAAFRQAVDWQPDYAAAHYNLASLAARQDRPGEALAQYERYIRLVPEDVNATLTLAGILFRGRHWSEAADLLERAERWAPGSPPVLLGLAQSRAQNGEIQQSLDALEAALVQVDVRQALAWTSRQEFDPVRHDPRFTQIIDRLAAGR